MSSFNARPYLDPQALARLGLDSARLGRGVRLSPKERRQRARRRSSRARKAWEPGFDGGLYHEASQPGVDLAGFYLQPCSTEDRAVYRLRCDTPDVSVEVVGGVAPWSRDAHDPSVLFIEVREDVVYRISRPDGTGVMVVHDAGKGVYAYDFRPKTGMVDVRRLRGSAPECPAEAWLNAAQPQWLADLVRARAGRRGMYSAAVAVGIWMRLHEPDANARSAALDALLGGAMDPGSAQPLTWFEALDPGHRMAALSGALSHAGALGEHVAMLRTTLQLDDAAWRDQLTSVLHIRDDLEGVRSLLLHTGDGELIDEELARFDEAGARFVRSLPRPVALWDPRLSRVAALDPSAWWADLARERRRAALSAR